MCINVRECAQNTLPRVEIFWARADNIGMNKLVYTVVEGEDNYGFGGFKLFDSEAKARAYAKGRMERLAHPSMDWVEDEFQGSIANWRQGCDYITIFIQEVE